MKRVSFTIDKIIGNFSSTLSLNVEIKASWRKIVGDELADFTAFYDSRYTGKNELSVFIKVLSAASVFAKYRSSRIIENLSKLIGGGKIKLIFQHVSFIAKSPICENTLREIVSKEPIKINVGFENGSLKNALELLKTEMQDVA